MMSLTCTGASFAGRKLAGSIFSTLPTTRSTSGIAAQAPGSICAAQPVTTIRAPGRSRRARRTAWRACRSASAVTAQVFTITASSSPAACAAIALDSAAFSRQPKVTTCGAF